ncbi:hypothetical protein SHKM778_27880 [Streptomyces sp. KM77-8]|uniref:Uncharacterized protein n=1 Tax=Streptomyces haneummycinicus TaxID=3074435 RepID=A0AAT9HG54_9ACTN
MGALAVTLAPIVLRSVLDLVRTWLENRPVRTVTVTLGDDSLELEGASSADQRRIVDAFLTAHGSDTEPPEPPQPAAGQGD